MKKEKLTLFIWGFVIFFLGLIFALSFVYTTTSQAQQNRDYQIYKIYSVKELFNFRNSNFTEEKLMFFRVSSDGQLISGKVFAFKKEDLVIYSDKIKMQTINGDFYIVMFASDAEKEGLKIQDQITMQDTPLLKYIETGANYTGRSLTDNFCPYFKFNPDAAYHLYDCGDWGCKVQIIQ